MKITFLTGHLAKERHMLLFELAVDLSNYGADVTVITGFPSRRITKETRDYYLSHPVEHINDHLVVKRVGSKRGEGSGLLQRFIRYLFLSKRIIKEAIKTKTDCYYIYSSPAFLGYYAKKLAKKAPVVYNAQDLFPDSLFAVKPKIKSTFFGSYLRKKEEKTYSNCSSIITISEGMKKTIQSRCSEGKRIEVVYNWSDFNSLKHISRSENKLFDEYDIPRDKFIISYGGDIGLFQNWDVVVKAASLLKDEKDIIFVLFGNGSKLEWLKNKIFENKLDNFYIFPMQPKNRISEVYSLGDLELVSLSKGFTSFALPSKIYNIFACKKPILALIDEESEYFDIINNNKFGYAIKPDDLDSLINSILKSRECELTQEGIAGYHYLIEQCSREKQTRKYFDIIASQISGD